MRFIYFSSARGFFTLLMAIFLLPYFVSAQSISRIGASPYPYSATPDSLYMINIDNLPASQQLGVITLQGLIAKTKPRIMVNRGATAYITDLSRRYGVVYDSTYFNDFRGLVARFQSNIGGYIICEAADTTTDAAISICSPLNAIAVNAPDTAWLDSLGVNRLYDLTIGPKANYWAFDTFQNRYSSKILTVQDYAKSSYLADYSIFAGAYQFYDFLTDYNSTRIFSSMQINGAVFGWAGENTLVSITSSHSLHVHASDWSNNLSVYTNFNIPQQQQHNQNNDTTIIPGTHTVCFVMTDGDNVQWLGGGFLNVSNWYGNPHRGEYNIGWTISPALAEIAPTQMKYIYDSATARDGFISGPSGMGYSYPDAFSMPDSGAAITSRMMQKADLSILNVIANNYSKASLAPYLAEPNIEAIFYYPYNGNYWELHGFTDCINGKPVISARYNLVQPDFSTYSLAQAIDSMPKNPYSEDGYSLIAVNVWSSTVDSVIKCIQMLDSNVRVVTPQSFVRLFMAGNNCIPAYPAGIDMADSDNGIKVVNTPNPCSDHMDIIYTLPEAASVTATLYDQCGRRMYTLFSDQSSAGTHSVTVDTHELSAGLYYYSFQGNDFNITRKCLVLK